MKKYKHLSQEQRYKIDAFIVAGNTISQVARFLNCHKSTISRELKRNGSRIGYQAQRAHQKCQLRHRLKPKYIKFSLQMRERVADLLEAEKLSPELICARERRTNPAFVSHETIYRWIWAMKYNYEERNHVFKKLYLHLKHGRKRLKRGNRRDKRGIIPNRISIEQRPSIVQQRRRLGDMEIDLMLGKNHLPGLLVITDRASLKTSLTKIHTRQPEVIARTIIQKMKPHKAWIKTLTYDNDISFAKHTQVNRQLQTRSFFTRPFTSQDKGTVENRIGVIRRFFPKSTDLATVSNQRIKKVEAMINNRPVRKFKYQTPNVVFLQKSSRCTN